MAAAPVRWDVVPADRPDHRHDLPEVADARLDRRLPPLRPRLAAPAPAAAVPGPLIRARVGDRIRVHFKNLDFRFRNSHSMHFHGVHYAFASDGSYIPGISGRGADVRPGRAFTYTLRAGGDSAGAWPYHDHGPAMDASIAGGMYGMLSILGRHERRPDREFVVALSSMRRLHDHQRPRLPREHAGVPGPGRQPRPLGRDGDGRRLPHVPRARPPLAEPRRARGRPHGRPGRELHGVVARAVAGCVATTTATSSRT